MPTLTLILGLCGSGKSHLARQIVAGAVFDEGFLKSKEQHAKLIATLNSGRDAVVVEIGYCGQSNRIDLLEELAVSCIQDVALKWLAFENDIRAANRNCRLRPSRNPAAHMRINRRLRKAYTYPDGATIFKVWRD